MNIYDRPTPETDALMEALEGLCKRASPDHGWLVPSVRHFEAANEILRAIKERK